MQDMQQHMSSLELSDSMEDSSGCQCDAAMKLSEVIKVNHCWNADYNELLEECKRLRNTEIQLKKLKEEFEVVKKIAFQKAESKNEEKKNVWVTKKSSACDEIEALKQQLIIYEEEFLQEKNECKKLLTENCTLKSNMQKANETIKNLSSKNAHLKEKYQHVYMERESIVNELKRLTNNSMDSLTGMSVPHMHKPVIESASSQDVMPNTARIVIPPARKIYGKRNIERN